MVTRTDTRKTLAQIVTMLCEVYGKQSSVAMLEAYSMGLSDLPLASVERATMTAIRTCRFMPTVAELRELAGEMKGTDRALKAWMAFQQAVVRHGAYKSVDFDDPVINATIRAIGGWERVCGMNATEFDTFLRKNFENVYASLYATGVGADQAEPLMGITDRENGMLGYNQRPPVRIETDLPEPASPRVARREPNRAPMPPMLELKKP